MTNTEIVDDPTTLCRVCFDFGEFFLNDYEIGVEINGIIITAAEMLAKFTTTMIENNNVPNMVCSNCLQELRTSYSFCNKIEMSEVKLQKVLDNFADIQSKFILPQTSSIEVYKDNPVDVTSQILLSEQIDEPIEMKLETILENETNYHEDHLELDEEFVDDYQNEIEIPITMEDNEISVQSCRSQQIFYTEGAMNIVSHFEEYDENEIEAITSKLEPSAYVCRRKAYTKKIPKIKEKKSEFIENGSFVVAQFVPSSSTVQVESYAPNYVDEGLINELRTMDYAAVKIKGSKFIEINEEDCNASSANTTKSVYYCQFCPRAFASSQFLITHVRKSHACKYCTSAFEKSSELYEHIRHEHKNHQCVVCKKYFSSNSNLRHHIKNVHGVKLPVNISLLSFKTDELTNDIVDDAICIDDISYEQEMHLEDEVELSN